MRLWPFRIRISRGTVVEDAWTVERWWPERDGCEYSGSITEASLRKAWSHRSRRGAVEQGPTRLSRPLTWDEDAVVEALGAAQNLHVALPEIHPADKEEFTRAIHAAQNIILARPAVEAKQCRVPVEDTTAPTGWLADGAERAAPGSIGRY